MSRYQQALQANENDDNMEDNESSSVIRDSLSSSMSAADVTRIANEVFKQLQPALLQQAPSQTPSQPTQISTANSFAVLDQSPIRPGSTTSNTPSELPKGIKLSQLDLSVDHHLTGNHYDNHNYPDWVYHITMHFSSLSHALFDPVTNTPGVACTAYHLIKNMTTPLQQKYRTVAKNGSGLELWQRLQSDYSGSSSQGQCRALKTVLATHVRQTSRPASWHTSKISLHLLQRGARK